MKSKFLLAAAIIVSSTMSSFAATGKGSVPSYIESAFNADFSYAGKVTWQNGTGYYKAAFIEAGIPVYAYYSASGDLMGVGRQLTTDQIPVSMSRQLQNEYAGYTLSEVYELGFERSGDYLIVLKKNNETLRLRTGIDQQLVVVK